MTKILNGKELGDKIIRDLKVTVEALGQKPCLAAVLVGQDLASQIYVKRKEKACLEIGYAFRRIQLPGNVEEDLLFETIRDLSNDISINGIIIQLPLPTGLKYIENNLIASIDSTKDVDGLNPINLGKLVSHKAGFTEDFFVPCTALGVMELLKAYSIDVAGKHVVMLGRSNLVGKPLGLLLLNAEGTVTFCHSKTSNLKEITQSADILIVAIGKPQFIDESYVKEGAVVIDVGINRTDSGLVGDVDYPSLLNKVSAMTPVPGGVGPMTVAMLMNNVYKSFCMGRKSLV